MVCLIRLLNESDRKILSVFSACSSDQRERVREKTNSLTNFTKLGPSHPRRGFLVLVKVLSCSHGPAGIFQLSNGFDIDNDFIPLFHVNRWVTEGSNPIGGAGQNDIPGCKGEALGEKRQ